MASFMLWSSMVTSGKILPLSSSSSAWACNHMRTSPTLSVEVMTRHSSLPVRTTPTMSMTSPSLDKIMPCESPKSWSKASMLPEYMVRTKRGASAPTTRMVPAMLRSTA